MTHRTDTPGSYLGDRARCARARAGGLRADVPVAAVRLRPPGVAARSDLQLRRRPDRPSDARHLRALGRRRLPARIPGSRVAEPLLRPVPERRGLLLQALVRRRWCSRRPRRRRGQRTTASCRCTCRGRRPPSSCSRPRQRNKVLVEAADPFVDFASFDTDGNGAVGRLELLVNTLEAESAAGRKGTGHRPRHRLASPSTARR